MVEKAVLPNGVRILWEKVPNVRSVTAGIWVATGSRYERKRDNGVSHFIEHMVFKGTETKTASEIAESMDAIGGQTDAFTTKEHTCFYGRVLDVHLDQLTDLLCDMFFHSRFDEEDLKSERSVISDEIDMYEDTPEDLAVERLLTAAYKGSPLAMPILGTKKSLSGMTGASLREYMQKKYVPGAVIIAVSGSFQDSSIDYLKSRFSVLKGSPKAAGYKAGIYRPAFVTVRKRIEQNHLCFAFPSVPAAGESRYAVQLMNGIFGGGMSSRLFQSVREKYGLCYSVYSFLANYYDTGVCCVYTALNKDTERQAMRVITDEIRRLREGGVTAAELDRAREQVKANVLMGLESTASRMHMLAKNELYLGRLPDIDESIARYDAVTAEDIAAAARSCFDFSAVSFSAVGKTEAADRYRELLSSLL